MIETKLIQGTFSQEDAQSLLTELTKTKIAFHERKITIHESEEDIKHSEKKIIQLGNNLRKMLGEIKSRPSSMVDIQAEILISIAN
jgi:hypothetical protein